MTRRITTASVGLPSCGVRQMSATRAQERFRLQATQNAATRLRRPVGFTLLSGRRPPRGTAPNRQRRRETALLVLLSAATGVRIVTADLGLHRCAILRPRAAVGPRSPPDRREFPSRPSQPPITSPCSHAARRSAVVKPSFRASMKAWSLKRNAIRRCVNSRRTRTMSTVREPWSSTPHRTIGCRITSCWSM